jgi:hypothetical protein
MGETDETLSRLADTTMEPMDKLQFDRTDIRCREGQDSCHIVSMRCDLFQRENGG